VDTVNLPVDGSGATEIDCVPPLPADVLELLYPLSVCRRTLGPVAKMSPASFLCANDLLLNLHQ
jgi:hypothetical protein